jgi:3-hydroxyisobutyrate dehydrogenase
MAARLVAAGFDLTAYDVCPERMSAFVAECGGRAAASLAETGRGADFLVTMLPNSGVVEDVLFGAEPLAQHLSPKALVVEMSSGAPQKTVAIAERLKALGIPLIDAPVSGGVARAVTGDLAVMVGGEAAEIERARGMLTVLGSSILPTGPLGSAHAMKALNNLASAASFLIGVEAMLIGKKFGLDPQVMVDVLNVSTGMSNSSQKKFSQFVLSRSFGSGFSLDLMLKDIGTALALGHDLGVDTPFAARCQELWAEGARRLGPRQDHTAIARVCEEVAGVSLAAPPAKGGEQRSPRDAA